MHNLCGHGGMVDAIDLGSIGTPMQVQVLLPAPLRNNRIDTKNISPFFIFRGYFACFGHILLKFR